MEKENNFKYIVYQTINTVNNKKYYGVHRTQVIDKFDGYIGDGIYINKPGTFMRPKTPFQCAVKKYGISKFRRTDVNVCDNVDNAFNLLEEYIIEDSNYNSHLVLRPKMLPIYQYDINGKLIKKWNSIFDAAEFFEVWYGTILEAITYQKSLYSYYWSYKDNIRLSNYSRPPRRVYQYKENGDIALIYNSLEDASYKLNISTNELINLIKTFTLYNGYYFSDKLQDEFKYKARAALKCQTLYVFSKTGELEFSGNLKQTRAYLKINSNQKISRAIKNRTLLSNKYIALSNKLSKTILVYKVNGDFIKECMSITEVCKEFNLNRGIVSKILKGVYKQTEGYTVKYKN